VKPTNACELRYFKHFHDGQLYKSIIHETGNQTAIDNILYQDAFEVENPLGSGKKLYKIVGM
jgi:hypothetical protein